MVINTKLTVYKEIPLETRRKFLSTKKMSAKKLEKYFSQKTKNIVLVLKHIQRRASKCLSKCSNMSMSYFPPQFDEAL